MPQDRALPKRMQIPSKSCWSGWTRRPPHHRASILPNTRRSKPAQNLSPHRTILKIAPLLREEKKRSNKVLCLLHQINKVSVLHATAPLFTRAVGLMQTLPAGKRRATTIQASWCYFQCLVHAAVSPHPCRMAVPVPAWAMCLIIHIQTSNRLKIIGHTFSHLWRKIRLYRIIRI